MNGIKDSSPLNTLSYFHVADGDGMPPDLFHDLFEGCAVDVISNIVIAYTKDVFFLFRWLQWYNFEFRVFFWKWLVEQTTNSGKQAT